MRDVAELARVSIATVSFVVNDTKPVSADTRGRVEEAMRELGYRRNVVGRALASNRTRIIALLFPALQHKFRGAAVQFFTSAAEAAREHGYSLVLWPISNDAGQATELTRSGLVDGVVLMEVQLDDPRVDLLRGSKTPFVLIGRTREHADLVCVDIDFESTVRTAMDRLVQLGHSAITLLDGSEGSRTMSGYGPVVRVRSTYQTEMERRKLAPVYLTCGETPSAGRQAAAAILSGDPVPTAVIVHNEHAAPGLVSGLLHAGRRIPGDISVLSIASSADIAMMSDPELDVMVSPGQQLGRMGVEALIDILEGNPPSRRQTLVTCTYEPGSTLGPARKAPGGGRREL